MKPILLAKVKDAVSSRFQIAALASGETQKYDIIKRVLHTLLGRLKRIQL